MLTQKTCVCIIGLIDDIAEVIMARSSELQTSIIKLLADGQEHTVQEMKQAINADGIEDYSDGMLSGSLNTLCRNGSIRKKRNLSNGRNRSDEKVFCSFGDWNTW